MLISIFFDRVLPQRIIAMCFNFFRLPLIEHCKVAVCLTGYTQKFIQLCMYGLSVAVFGPLDE